MPFFVNVYGKFYMSLSLAYLQWALQKEPNKEHVFFANFVRRFDLFHEESATREFGLLLESPSIRTRRREKLKRFFRDFQEHHRVKFWADRTLQLNTEVTVRRAGVIVQDSGVIQAKVACEEFFSSKGRGLLDLESMDDSGSEGDAEDHSESKGDAEEKAKSFKG